MTCKLQRRAKHSDSGETRHQHDMRIGKSLSRTAYHRLSQTPLACIYIYMNMSCILRTHSPSLKNFYKHLHFTQYHIISFSHVHNSCIASNKQFNIYWFFILTINILLSLPLPYDIVSDASPSFLFIAYESFAYENEYIYIIGCIYIYIIISE